MDLALKFPPVISAFMASDARHRFVLGPFGSGKSVGSQVDIVRRAWAQRPSVPANKRKSRFAVVRNTRPQLRDTTLKTWLDYFPSGTLGTYHSTTNTYTIKSDRHDVECEIVFRPLDDASDVKNLLSLDLTGAYINEFRDTPREIVEALDGRIGRYPRMDEGGPSWQGIWGDSNYPEEGSFWERMLEGYDPDAPKVKKLNKWAVFKQPPAMLRLAGGGFAVNPLAENLANLPPGYYEHLIQNKTDDYIRTYVMCEYGLSLGGKPVHPMFNRAVHVAKTPLVPDRNSLLLISADFGLTPALVLKQQNAFGQVLALDEIVTFGMGIERAIEEKLLPLLRRKYDGFDIFVTGDPSGNKGSEADEASCAAVFRRYKNKGLGRVKLAWSNNPVHRRGATDHFLSRLGDYGRPMYQVDPGCQWLIQALGGKYMFKKFKDGRESSDVDKNDWSHIGDANQYGDMYFERGGRRKAEQKERATVPTVESMNYYATPR
ncbi:MAG: hypothetical protein DDT20_00859 [Firmicutes bacterium]|nr:hypothetical protein [Bacillota bacterium]